MTSNSIPRWISVIALSAFLGAGLLTPLFANAQNATPVVAAELPAGTLGEQMQWLVDYINLPADDAAQVELAEKFTPEVLQQVSAEQLEQILDQVRSELAPVTIDTETIATTRDLPATNARFMLVGRGGIQLPISLSVDRDTGLIDGIFFEQPVFPVASPVASPATIEEATTIDGFFPDNEIGRQAAWTWSTLQPESAGVSAADLEQHLAPEVLAQISAEQVATGIEQVKQAYGPFTLEPNSVITSRDEPATQLSYVVVGKAGDRFQISMTLDRDSGLLSGYLITPAPSTNSSDTMPLPENITDIEISFESDGDTIYGSFMTPADFSTAESHPAALIISGSGPTDRNGDSPGFPLGTNRNLALTLAENGIPSLRYDKLGSGRTAFGNRVDPATVDYELFLQEANDAAAFLAQQPGIDPDQLIIVGHSEGALFALTLAQAMIDAGTPPAALMLVAPLSTRYLDLVKFQTDQQVTDAVTAGQLTQDQADEIETELTSAIENLRTTGDLSAPISDPNLAAIFSPANVAFLAQIDKIDPANVAASLPHDLPVLILLGEKDSQITPDEVHQLMTGFEEAGNADVTLVLLPNANHALRIVEGTPNPAVDYRNANLPFSPEAVQAIDEFLSNRGFLSGR